MFVVGALKGLLLVIFCWDIVGFCCFLLLVVYDKNEINLFGSAFKRFHETHYINE